MFNAVTFIIGIRINAIFVSQFDRSFHLNWGRKICWFWNYISPT